MSSIDLEIDSLSSLLDDMTKNDPFKARVRDSRGGEAELGGKSGDGTREARQHPPLTTLLSPLPALAGVIWIYTPSSRHSIHFQVQY